jgi:hypothetical protein
MLLYLCTESTVFSPMQGITPIHLISCWTIYVWRTGKSKVLRLHFVRWEFINIICSKTRLHGQNIPCPPRLSSSKCFCFCHLVLLIFSKVKAQQEQLLLLLEFVTVNDYLFLLKAVAKMMDSLKSNAMFYLAAAVSDFFIPDDLMVIMN